MQAYQPTTWHLAHLIGLPPSDVGCFLSAAQLTRLGKLLIQERPTDPQSICLLGGALERLVHGTGSGTLPPISVARVFGDDPFLVIAGPHGALTLLASAERGGYQVRLLTDPEYADQIALTLSQVGDVAYTMNALCDQEHQRAFIARIAVALCAERAFQAADLSALMPQEQSWLTLAEALGSNSDLTMCLRLPAVRQLIQPAGRVLFGQFDADRQQLLVLACEGDTNPGSLPVEATILAQVARERGPISAAPTARGEQNGQRADWLNGRALYAAPLMRAGEVWGVLLAASDRLLPVTVRANLHGLSGAFSAALRPTPLTVAPTQVRRAAIAAPRPAGAAAQLALLQRMHEAVLLSDAHGRIAGATDGAVQMLHLSGQFIGRSLVEGGSWVLAPVLTEALMGELGGSHTIELPDGRAATATVSELGPELWAFVIELTASAPAVAAAPIALAAPTQPEPNNGERNEHFLLSFSNIVRAPLQSLRNLIMQVPAAGQLNEQQSQLIGEVIKLNSELSMLVNDLLALGQIRLQSAEHRAPLRLDLLVEAAVGTQYAEFGRRGQQVTTNIASNLPRVYADEESIGRAIGAIVDNAIKYSPTGALITVTVDVAADQVQVVVADNGPGLSPDELALVFDPFYRTPSTAHSTIPGRGLGLTIAKTVIEQHNGRIWAESTPGRGSTFAFSVPCLSPTPLR